MSILQLDDRDNVAVVTKKDGFMVGDQVSPDIYITENLNFGQKVALRNFIKGDEVIRYGSVIGFASTSIQSGSCVNPSNLANPEVVSLNGFDVFTKVAPGKDALTDSYGGEEPFFMGFKNIDGTVGTRNYLAISATVHCVSGVVKHAISLIEQDLLPLYANVDGVVFLDHAYGCGVAIDAQDADIPINTISSLTSNPNFGDQVMFVGLGCEKLRRSMLMVKEHSFISLQGEKLLGFQSMVSEIFSQAKAHLEILNKREREKCPISALTIGVQCGGSDSMSGITANPLVGKLADLVISKGGSVIFSEITEVRDAASDLFSRCETPEVAKKLLREFKWYDRYLGRSGADHSANTTPGNKAGGISNIVEKALGSVTKSGQTAIVDVLHPGQKIQKRGLNFLAGPASDFICGTLQFAAGSNLHIFTTGRGTPYSIDGFPTIKVSSNSDLASKWSDIIDFDAGVIVERGINILRVRDEFLALILAIASGEETAAERLKISNSIVLFNPAPVT